MITSETAEALASIQSSCDLNQFFAAAGTNSLPQVQSKTQRFRIPRLSTIVFWNH
jgi:hypothetical protein